MSLQRCYWVTMSIVDIHSVDGGQQLEDLDFAGIEPYHDGPDYDQLLIEEAEIASGSPEHLDQSAFEDGSEVGRSVLAQELLDAAPGGLANQAEAARWARWVAHQLERIVATPKL